MRWGTLRAISARPYYGAAGATPLPREGAGAAAAATPPLREEAGVEPGTYCPPRHSTHREPSIVSYTPFFDVATKFGEALGYGGAGGDAGTEGGGASELDIDTGRAWQM